MAGMLTRVESTPNECSTSPWRGHRWRLGGIPNHPQLTSAYGGRTHLPSFALVFPWPRWRVSTGAEEEDNGRDGFREERRAGNDDRASGSSETPHRLQAPRPELPLLVTAHGRQRRVRGLLQGRQDRRRAAAGPAYPLDPEHSLPEQHHQPVHGG